MDPGRPKVGLAVFVTSARHPGAVILGVRKNECGRGTYAVPGGHLEFGESFEECARREVLEETGLQLKRVQFDQVINVVWPENNYHYVDILMWGETDGEPVNMEPDKCAGWEWIDWANLPEWNKLFKPLQDIVDSGYNPIQTAENAKNGLLKESPISGRQ